MTLNLEVLKERPRMRNSQCRVPGDLEHYMYNMREKQQVLEQGGFSGFRVHESWFSVWVLWV